MEEWFARMRSMRGVMLGVCCCAGSAAATVDPQIEYVQRLQEEGMSDLAVEYLRMASSAGASGVWGDQLDYQLGKALLQTAEGAAVAREAALIDEGLSRLEKYRTEHPDTDEAMDARSEITAVTVARAQRLLAQARLATSAEIAKPLRQQALAALDRAIPEVEEIIARYEKRLNELAGAKQIEDRPRKRRGGAGREERSAGQLMLEGRKLEVELRRGMIDYLAGQAYDRNDPAQKKESDARLQRSAAQFDQLFQKYRAGGTLAASYALLWQGRVRQELGQWQEAEDIYREVLAGEPSQTTGVDELRADLFGQARLFWCQVKNQTGQPAEVVENRYYSAPEWLNRSAERRRERFGLGIQLELAKAYIALAEKNPAEEKESRKLMRDAMKLLADGVCRYSSEFLPEGMALREKYGARVSNSAESMKDLASFDEAVFIGGSALSGKDWPRAVAAYQQALSLVKRDTDAEQVADVQYRLALALMQSGDVDAGTKLALELAEARPTRRVSAEGAGLALSAQWKKYRQIPESDSAARRDQRQALESTLGMIKERFPLSSQAQTARFLTGVLLGSDKKYEESALAYEEVTADGENFAESRLRAGQMLWGAYRERLERKESPGDLVERARGLFQSASESFLKQASSPTEWPAGFVEAKWQEGRLLQGTGKPTEALDLLEPLVASKRDLGRWGIDVAVTAVESALAAGHLDRAEKLVDAMMASEKAGTGGTDRVAATLVRLGQSLQQEVNRLSKEGRVDEAGLRKKSLEQFLSKLASRPDQTVATLRYLSDSYEALGESVQAAATLERAIDMVKRSTMPAAEQEKLLASLQVRRVRSLRQAGDFESALREVELLLADYQRRLPKSYPLALELEKCEILDGMGKKDPGKGAAALAAWGALAERLRSAKVKPREFFVARLASARWTEQLQGAQAAIPVLKSTLALHPDGGGPELKKEFERLLREWSVK